jgi:hypothetical protein
MGAQGTQRPIALFLLPSPVTTGTLAYTFEGGLLAAQDPEPDVGLRLADAGRAHEEEDRDLPAGHALALRDAGAGEKDAVFCRPRSWANFSLL